MLPNDLALPVISGQRTNEHLKTIAQMCRINSDVVITTYKGNKRIDIKYKKIRAYNFSLWSQNFCEQCPYVRHSSKRNNEMDWSP